jgi:hypothetical protein
MMVTIKQVKRYFMMGNWVCLDGVEDSVQEWNFSGRLNK